MTTLSATLHEDPSRLGPAAIDRHRAIISLIEELEAADWYDQRSLATDDEALREILIHNRDEEKEHAAMVLEWLRRHDDALNLHLRAYLFTDGPIHKRKPEKTALLPQVPGDEDESLGVGSLSGAQ
jgi:ferritin-like protein